MSIQTELTRITNAKSAIKTAIEGKGVTVPDATLLDGMASLIESIEAGGGGGSGAKIHFGTFTPADNIDFCRFDCDVTSMGDGQKIYPRYSVIFDTNTDIVDSVSKQGVFSVNYDGARLAYRKEGFSLAFVANEKPSSDNPYCRCVNGYIFYYINTNVSSYESQFAAGHTYYCFAIIDGGV